MNEIETLLIKQLGMLNEQQNEQIRRLAEQQEQGQREQDGRIEKMLTAQNRQIERGFEQQTQLAEAVGKLVQQNRELAQQVEQLADRVQQLTELSQT